MTEDEDRQEGVRGKSYHHLREETGRILQEQWVNLGETIIELHSSLQIQMIELETELQRLKERSKQLQTISRLEGHTQDLRAMEQLLGVMVEIWEKITKG